jgi:AcrR family transcriptional regulator
MNLSPVRLRDRQKQHTRAEIVRVAFELFGKQGYEQVPVEAIAAAAGVSRATFFNYFPQKDLLLREVAQARVERLESILSEVHSGATEPTVESILELVLKLCRENARITRLSKKLMMETMFSQASRGLLLPARDRAVDVLTGALKAVAGNRRKARQFAETLFAVYLGTMLEWMVRENVAENWLVNTMRQRLQPVFEAFR